MTYWESLPDGATVALDTSPLIYFVERHPAHYAVMRPLFQAVADRKVSFITSAITVTEVLTQPLRFGDRALAESYQSLFRRAAVITVMPVITTIAVEAAALRARYRLKTLDVLQIATAKTNRATCFVTNDVSFLSVEGIHFVLLKHLLPAV